MPIRQQIFSLVVALCLLVFIVGSMTVMWPHPERGEESLAG